MTDTKVEVKELFRRITIKVAFIETPNWKLRKSLAVLLIKLAAKILGCGIEIVNKAQS